MTETTKTVFEKYQVRKTKKQKAAFREYVGQIATREGYACREEKGSLGAKNIVVGDPETAKVVYTAHYDTCAVLPFPNFITPKNIWIYLIYQLAILAALFAAMFLIGCVIGIIIGLLGVTGVDESVLDIIGILVADAVMIGFIIMVLAGPANKHTANDNTSGVTVLLDTMQALSPEARNEAAFIFFDLEEAGLFGSMGFASKHKTVMKEKLIVNFDCVSEGDTMLFAVKKGARKYVSALKEACSSDECSVDIGSKGVFYPSDQANFSCGVGVAACRGKGRNIYLSRIHTPRDTVYTEKNIEYFVNGAVKLIGLL